MVSGLASSMAVMRAERDMSASSAMRFKAFQNVGSRDKDVLCPAMVTERFSGCSFGI